MKVISSGNTYEVFDDTLCTYVSFPLRMLCCKIYANSRDFILKSMLILKSMRKIFMVSILKKSIRFLKHLTSLTEILV